MGVITVAATVEAAGCGAGRWGGICVEQVPMAQLSRVHGRMYDHDPTSQAIRIGAAGGAWQLKQVRALACGHEH